MGVTPNMVRGQSFSGEFAGVSDLVLQSAIDEAALHYRSLVPHRGVKVEIVNKLIALHAAHLVHKGKKEEAGDDANDQPGPVKSASLDRVGSWTFASGGEAVQNKGEGPIADWASSPYGRRWHGLWRGLPPGLLAVPGPYG